MLFKNINTHNYLVTLIVLLAVIAVLSTAAFLLVFYLPGIFAEPPFAYETKELYSFEPWAFELEDLEVSFPEGGLILPLFREERQEAAIVLANGAYTVSGHPPPHQKPAGLFLVTDEHVFDEIRGCIVFLPVDDEEAKQRMTALHEQQYGLPIIWESAVPLTFRPDAGSTYYYFISEEGEAIMPPSLREPAARLHGSLVLYAILMIILLLMMTVFSLDHRPTRYWQALYQAGPDSKALGLAAAAALLALGGETLPLLAGLPEYCSLSGYLVAITLLIVAARFKVIAIGDGGLNLNRLHCGYFLALAAAAMFVIITRGVPQHVSFSGGRPVGELIYAVLVAGLARELIWRGYIQTTFGRRWGAARGLLLTVLLAGLVHFATVALKSPELLSYPYTQVELLILAPGSAAVLGYLYLRTENILSCVLLQGFLTSLSSLIT